MFPDMITAGSAEPTNFVSVVGAGPSRWLHHINPLVFVTRHCIIAVRVCKYARQCLNDTQSDTYVEPNLDGRSSDGSLCVRSLGSRGEEVLRVSKLSISSTRT